MFVKKRGQTVQEYVIVLGLVAAALIAMQTYMKRGVQGRLRDLANQISPKQFESNETTSTTVIARDGNTTETENLGTYTVADTTNTSTVYNSTTVEK